MPPKPTPIPSYASAAQIASRAIIGTSRSPQTFLRLALSFQGTPYVFGAEASPSNPRPRAFDCSEFVEWLCLRLGIYMPDGSRAQYAHCKRKGLEVSVEQAIRTPAALLFVYGTGNNRTEHVAISQGNGKTIEAAGRAYGTLQRNARGRSFNKAGLIPGLNYGAVNVDTSGGRPPSFGNELVDGTGEATTTLPSPDPGLFLQLIAAIVATMKRVLAQGAVGGAVTILQVRLQQLGYPVVITNRFDFATKTLVQQYQTQQRLRADGVVGPVTWARLYPNLVPNAFPDGTLTAPPQ